MILQHRINCLVMLGDYMLSAEPAWTDAKRRASIENGWFIPEFIELAAKNIVEKFLKKDALQKWTSQYGVPTFVDHPKTVGIVMAGNLPLVGFHDLLAVFASGHKAAIQASSKDVVLIRHLVEILREASGEIGDLVGFYDMLKNCDAYIATGSNNTSRYFEYYFGKYPNIIRRNKTSVAILAGNESPEQLGKLADDISQFFGMGCRNVSKIYVPRDYDFGPMLHALKKYNYLADHHKYKNNYDYNLALHLLNNKFYMTSGSLLLVEEAAVFSPISQVNYEYYSDKDSLLSSLNDNPSIQAVVGTGLIPFGQAQSPSLFDYADQIDTMAFVNSL